MAVPANGMATTVHAPTGREDNTGMRCGCDSGPSVAASRLPAVETFSATGRSPAVVSTAR